MARCYIMTSMSSQMQLEHKSFTNAANIMLNLNELFGEKDRAARFEAMRKLMTTRMTEGTSVRDHVLKMMNAQNELDELGGAIEGEAKIDMILHTLPKSIENFRLNVVMNKKEYTSNELLNDLVTAEAKMNEGATALSSVKAGSSTPKGGNKKKAWPPRKKLAGSSGSKGSKPTGGIKKPKEKGKCFRCNKMGHWKADCPLKKKNGGISAEKGAE